MVLSEEVHQNGVDFQNSHVIMSLDKITEHYYLKTGLKKWFL